MYCNVILYMNNISPISFFSLLHIFMDTEPSLRVKMASLDSQGQLEETRAREQRLEDEKRALQLQEKKLINLVQRLVNEKQQAYEIIKSLQHSQAKIPVVRVAFNGEDMQCLCVCVWCMCVCNRSY